MRKLKSIDLFAGIGGIRMGFDRAFGDEINTVFVSEWDEAAQKTYKANFDDSFPIAGDITKIMESDIPKFDICLAGFPCQAFSIAGTGGAGRNGFSDSFRGQQALRRTINNSLGDGVCNWDPARGQWVIKYKNAPTKPSKRSYIVSFNPISR